LEDRCWKKPKDGKAHPGSTNFLEVMLNDEEATLHQLNKLCGSENLFSYIRVPKRRMPVAVAPAALDAAIEGSRANREEYVRSKILSHFIKGKISLTPMETVMMIPGELEHLESLVKVARQKKDAEAASNQVSMVSAAPTIRRLSINKTHRNKTLHLSVEVNSYLVEGLVDTGASMSVMAVTVVRELGLMHLVSGSETYKTTLGTLTQALGRIDEVPIKVGGVQCNMTFMVVDTDSYDVLLGLDLLIKIGAIIDIEQGLIQVKRGPGTDVEVLPLTMINLMQRSDSKTNVRDDANAPRYAPGNSDAVDGLSSLWEYGTNEQMIAQESESDSDSNEDSNEGTQPVGPVDGEFEFGDTELEDLVVLEGPQQILQLTLERQVGDFMKEEITDADDYADWIRWAADVEQGKQTLPEATSAT
jgi:predicted aspartyl protease